MLGHHVPLCAGTPAAKFARMEEDPVQVLTNQKNEEMRKCEVLLALLNLDHVNLYFTLLIQSNALRAIG